MSAQPTLDELRRTMGGGHVAVTRLVVSPAGLVTEFEATNCVDEQWGMGGVFYGVTPNPREAWSRCLLHGLPSLARGEDGMPSDADLAASYAKFGLS